MHLELERICSFMLFYPCLYSFHHIIQHPYIIHHPHGFGAFRTDYYCNYLLLFRSFSFVFVLFTIYCIHYLCAYIYGDGVFNRFLELLSSDIRLGRFVLSGGQSIFFRKGSKRQNTYFFVSLTISNAITSCQHALCLKL